MQADYFRLLANLNKLSKSFDLIKADGSAKPKTPKVPKTPTAAAIPVEPSKPKMLPDEQAIAHLPEQHRTPLLNWARAKIPSTQARSWYLHNVGQKLSDHKASMAQMEHHGAMMGKNKHINGIQFNKKLSLNDGLHQLREADSKWQQEQEQGGSLIKPDADTHKVVDLGNGWSWYNLNTDCSDAESRAMGHCGTASSSSANLFSLRKEVKMGSQTFHQPHITAEVYEGGMLRQMKGRNNQKPDSKYHEAILPFLTSEHINHKLPSEYMPETDFQIEDLKPEHRAVIEAKKPHLDPFSSTNPSHADKMVRALKKSKIDSQDLGDMFDEDEFNEDPLVVSLRAHKKLLKNYKGDIGHAMGTDKDTGFLAELAKHPRATPDHIHMALKTNIPSIQRAASTNINASKENLMQAIKTGVKDISQGVARNSALMKHPEIVDYMVDNGNSDHQDAIARSPLFRGQLRPEQADKLLVSNDPMVRLLAVSHHATQKHLDQIFNGDNEDMKAQALTNKNITHDHVKLALSSPSALVRGRAIDHPDFHKVDVSDHQLEKILDEDGLDSDTRRQAIQHPNVTSEHISQALKDSHPRVREQAIQHPNVTTEHLDQALEDRSFNVRTRAAEIKKRLGL